MNDSRTTEHRLKCWPEFFQAIRDGRKTFEIRENDRGFEVGDTLFLGEFDPNTGDYTGRQERCEVTYITAWKQLPGYIVMGIRR